MRNVYFDTTFYHYVLAFITTYIYIGHNESFSAAGIPLDSIMNSYLQRISHPEKFYEQFQDAPGYIPPILEKIFKNDLCINLFIDPQEIDICYQTGDGAPQHGLISTMTWIGRTLNTMKDTYDVSNKTQEAIKDILNQTYVKDLEIMFDTVFLGGFEAMNSRVTDYIFDQQAIIYFGIILRTIFTSLIFGILPLLIGNWIFKYLEKLSYDYKIVLKMIPISILRSNRSLKAFLLKISPEILNSIKNKI